MQSKLSNLLLVAALAIPTLAAATHLPTTPAAGEVDVETDADLQASLDARVPALLREHGVPNVSVARIEDGRIVLLAAWGEQSPGVPATPATLYNVASMAKPVSAEVVLRLASAQRLSLDEPMSAWWIDPDLAGDPRHERLTPRFALSHRTGFPNWRRETAGKLAFLRDPGGEFGYSGEGFEYLKAFVERRTRESFSALAGALVFAPVGMHDSTYTDRPWLRARIATPVDADGVALPPQIARTLVASDDLYTTPNDYARFMLAIVAQQDISPALFAERMKVQADRRAQMCPPAEQDTCPQEAGFGLGWEVFAFADQRWLMHTGMDAGTFALGYFDPVAGDGTIIFTSSSVGWKLVMPLLDTIGRDPQMVEFLRRQAD
jgi:CubicO group peptidase (beta-lactamase class C family)